MQYSSVMCTYDHLSRFALLSIVFLISISDNDLYIYHCALSRLTIAKLLSYMTCVVAMSRLDDYILVRGT